MEESININDIHEIMQTPSKFHVPDYNHKEQIRNTVQENKKHNHTEQPLNDMEIYDNNDLMLENNSLINEIFNNTEEEIIFNYDKINEDELSNKNHGTIQHNIQTAEETHNTNEKHMK